MKTQLDTLTFEECDKLLRYLQQPQNKAIPTRVYHRNYTMALIMLDTGCRVGELMRLTQDQLWFANAPVNSLIISKDQAKNNRERLVPITKRLHDAIERMHRQWWSIHPNARRPYAFYYSNPHLPITIRQIQRIIKSAGALSIGRDIHPHILRHTFASRLMRKTSMRVVQQLLGHSSISSTQIYTHPNIDDCQKAIDSLNERS